MKPKFLLFLLIVVAFIAYQRLPGLKARAENFVNQYGGWTEEAIQKDPAKFIEHAQEKLRGNLAQFEESRRALTTNKATYQERLAKFRTELENADALAVEFRTAYRQASEGGSFPIELIGQDYSEGQVVEQVQTLLTQKKNAQARIEDYQSLLALVDGKRSELTDRISSTNAKLDELDAKKEMVRLDQLTAEADELLDQVNDLMIENGKAIESSDPVRSVADLMQELESKTADETPEPASDAMAFLQAGN